MNVKQEINLDFNIFYNNHLGLIDSERRQDNRGQKYINNFKLLPEKDLPGGKEHATTGQTIWPGTPSGNKSPTLHMFNVAKIICLA
jgi:hypothetical protein